MGGEWKKERLSNLCSEIADCPHSTPLWTDSGALVLRSQNIRNGRLDLSAKSYTDEAHFEQRSRRARLRGGDLVITREAPMGEVCLIPDGLRCCLGQRMVMLRPDPKKCDSRFLLYSIQSRAVQDEIKVNEGTGSTVSNLRIPLLEALPIPHPPLAEQKAIAAVLGALDDKIELNRRMNATLEAMVRALFQSWFVDFDPVRAKLDGRAPAALDPATAALFPDSFHETKVRHIPSGWQLGRLVDLCNLKRGHDLPTSTRTAGPIPVISSSGISGTHFETQVRGPGVVTGRYGTIGKVFYVETDYWPLNTTLYVDDFKGSPPRFIFHALGEVDFTNYTDKAAVPGVNRNHLHEEATVIPSMEVRQAFARTVEPLWSQHAANDRQSRTLATLRDTLLPKLLSGELTTPGQIQ